MFGLHPDFVKFSMALPLILAGCFAVGAIVVQAGGDFVLRKPRSFGALRCLASALAGAVAPVFALAAIAISSGFIVPRQTGLSLVLGLVVYLVIVGTVFHGISGAVGNRYGIVKVAALALASFVVGAGLFVVFGKAWFGGAL
jgi:hypothetical protein